MNTVYFNFLFIQTIKRKPVWITWMLFLFVSCCFLIILPYVTSLNTLQVWANTTVSISQTIMGMVASIFTAVLAINIFRDTRDEGTELIVISKPISRFKIVLTKFFVFGFVCLLVNISSVILTSFTIFLPETETKYYAGLLISMFIGNAVTFAVFGSISILFSVKFARIGVIITNIVISLVFLIYQVLAAFLFSTPLKALNDRNINAYNYIVANRNTETGEYEEREIVDFNASAPEAGKEHPCQATTWQEMRDYWEHDIKSIDPTPMLNATDVASQLSLTYMSYKTHEFSQQQAQRFFGISRFDDYKLTGPASMEIMDNDEPMNWVYTYETWVEIPTLPGFHIPSWYCFPTIRPLSAAKLRGLRDKLPIGTIRSREILSMKEVYFEPDDWCNYKEGFDAIYQDVLDYKHYSTSGIDDLHLLTAFSANQSNLADYYQNIWACLTGHGQQYLPNTNAASFSKDYYDINNPYDLNVRFMQFKNYSYWKALKEQQESLNNVSDKDYIHNAFVNGRKAVEDKWKQFKTKGIDLGLKFPEEENWWMESDGLKTGLLAPNTRTVCLDLAHNVWDQIIQDPQYTKEDLTKIFMPMYYKTTSVLHYISSPNEHYMFTSLDQPIRNDTYYGTTYFEQSRWYPNVSGILKDIFEFNMPVGQNLVLFYYQVSPKIQYWIYAVIWAAISLAAYGAGALVYNKYDVK